MITTNKAVSSDGLRTKSEVAQLLQISPRTLDVYIARRAIPHVKLGATKNAPVRFRQQDIDSYLASQSVEAA